MTRRIIAWCCTIAAAAVLLSVNNADAKTVTRYCGGLFAKTGDVVELTHAVTGGKDTSISEKIFRINSTHVVLSASGGGSAFPGGSGIDTFTATDPGVYFGTLTSDHALSGALSVRRGGIVEQTIPCEKPHDGTFDCPPVSLAAGQFFDVMVLSPTSKSASLPLTWVKNNDPQPAVDFDVNGAEAPTTGQISIAATGTELWYARVKSKIPVLVTAAVEDAASAGQTAYRCD